MESDQHNSSVWADDLALIESAAREAGAVALSHFGHDPEVWWKNGGQSPVSAADFAANSCLETILRKARPDYGWLSEESDDDKTRTDCDRVFVVDPIDGTRGFINGSKQWVVSVAVVSGTRPVAGVLVAPALGEVFVAHLGGAALKNGQVIGASSKLAVDEDASINLCIPSSLKTRFDDAFRERLTPSAYIPSLAYRLAMVADGQLDGTLVRSNSHDWDLAAADIILTQAGAVLADVRAQVLAYNQQEVTQGTLFAGSPTLVDRLLRHFRPGDRA